MHILKPGSVKTNGYRGPGQILLTETSLFAFRSNNSGAQAGAQVGGLLGALGGHLVDLWRARGVVPVHLNDPEIRGLDPSVQKRLRRETLLVKAPLVGLKVRRKTMGFVFESDGLPSITYTGWVHKKSILAFLEGRSIHSIEG